MMNIFPIQITRKMLILMTLGAITIILFGVVLLSIRPTNDYGYQNYIGSRYTLSYPSNWSFKEVAGNEDVIFSLSKTSATPFIEVKAMDANKGGASVEAYSNEFLDNANKNLTGFKLDDLNTITLLNVPATKVDFRFMDGGSQSLKSTQIDIRSDDRVYRLNYTSNEAQYDEFYPVFTRLLSGFRVY